MISNNIILAKAIVSQEYYFINMSLLMEICNIW